MASLSNKDDSGHPQTSPGIVLLLAAQHVIVLFSGIILVPVMLVNIYNLSSGSAHYFISATTLCAAAATLMQLFRGKHFGLGSPMFMGTSGAFMACAHSAFELGGGSLFAAMVLLSAPFQLAFSYCIRFLRHILTPTVGGVIIMLAVVGLLKDSISTWTNANMALAWTGDMKILTGAMTIAVMIVIEWFGRRKLRPWSLPLGILAGCGFAAIAGLPVLPDLSDSPWLGFAMTHWPGLQFSTTSPEHWTLLLTFVLAIFATSVKYTGDAMVLQQVTSPGKKKIDYDAVQGGLYANGASIILSGLACAMPSTSHSANIPLMEMTGTATRRVAVVASLLLVAISLSPKMLHLLINLPQPVIGGVGVVLVGHLFSAGMKLVAMEMNHRNGLIAGLSLCAGLISERGDFFPAEFPDYLAPLTHNGVALGGIVAIVLTVATRISIERGVRITTLPKLTELPHFKQLLTDRISRFKLDQDRLKYLELACEEVFLYMREECRQIDYSGPVTFTIRQTQNGLGVEASGGTRFSSEADELVAQEVCCPAKLGEEDLNALGMILLGHVATDVSHVTIAGYTFIGFTLPEKG
ncbi:solute carrier family 23 protein [uncultured Pseudodesulfovibrio sp.]|uniref:solute carrier family 23 protein n=1 Tax=uncultured Pseudodesulfovibrio sp. TaxID=2035858 RepID=UPI0029C958C9|nr:solute carrier family 23 protein [uncultured Pseudodesulfovibrio sp.]